VALLLGIVFCCSEKRTSDIKSGSAEDRLPFYNDATFTAEWIEPNDSRYRSIHRIDDFHLTNQMGNFINRDSLSGKIYTANFFFSICPSICPKMTNNLLQVQEAFRNDANVKLVSFSVMPWHDSVEVLKEYSKEKNILNTKWYLLTGEKEKIYELARKSYFAEKTLGVQKSVNEFLHTETVLLIDKKSRIRGIYNATLPVDMGRIIEDINILKKEG
jgi:protein SCO1/2